MGAVGDHVAGDAFGFHALQVPGVAAGGEGCLLFESQILDGRVDGLAHDSSFLEFLELFGLRCCLELFGCPNMCCFRFNRVVWLFSEAPPRISTAILSRPTGW